MIIVFVLILWFIGLSLALALYSNFLPSFSLLRDIKNYNMAYYWANSSIERSLLVLRYQEAWFEASGWWSVNPLWVLSDNSFDQFSYFDSDTHLFWDIQSRSHDGLIPLSGMWNAETSSHNILKYWQLQTIPLWVDNTPPELSYVNDPSRQQYDGENLDIWFILPPSLQGVFEDSTDQYLLSDEDCSFGDVFCDIDGDGYANDIVIWWTLNGLLTVWDWYPFSIISRNLIGRLDGWSDIIHFSNDSSIRENDINIMTQNNTDFISFSNNLNPLNIFWRTDNPSWHSIIGSENVFDNDVDMSYFRELFQNPNVVDLELKLSLLQKLITRNNNIYPYLHYKIEVDTDSDVAQPYFYIQWQSKVGDYVVRMNVTKPLDRQNVIDSFTVIF